jgi:uncharacterized protein (DUF433 family)
MSQGNTPGSVGIPDEDVRQVRGTRLSVEFVIGLMADGWSEADILRDYPGVTHGDIIACLAYARDTLSSEKVFPSAA